MLAADFYEVPNFKVRIFNARAAVGNVYKNSLGSLIVFVLHCSADAQHKVGSLFFDLDDLRGTSLLKVCRSSLDILAISCALSKESRRFTAAALNLSISSLENKVI
jgi:hypothetical protein